MLDEFPNYVREANVPRIKNGLKAGRRWEGGMEVCVCLWIIYLSLHCHHQNKFCIRMGSDESHFNVS